MHALEAAWFKFLPKSDNFVGDGIERRVSEPRDSSASQLSLIPFYCLISPQEEVYEYFSDKPLVQQYPQSEEGGDMVGTSGPSAT